MRIAVLALRCSCDYLQVGGAESVVRRLGLGLADAGHTVHYVLYGDNASRTLPVNEQLSVYYCRTFDEALSILRNGYDHVLTVYLLQRDRLCYAGFQLSRRATSFHRLALGTPASLGEWGAFMAEVLFTTRNGRVFTTSPVTRRVLSNFGTKVVLLLPPVPKAYFQTVVEKRGPESPLAVGFLGRLAPEKGWNEALAAFQRVRAVDGVHTYAFGYSASAQEDGLVVEEWHDGACVSRQRASRQLYDPQGDEGIRAILRRTDILLLPYQSMHGTIDPPLLLLEGMAAGCAIITRHAGQVGVVYGTDTPFMITDGDYVEKATGLIESICREPSLLVAERRRVRERVEDLRFESSLVTEQLVRSLQEDS